MASNDDVDFHARIEVLDDQNREILKIGLTQKQTLMILIGMMAVFFIVLVAFNAIESKEIVDLTEDVVKVGDIIQGSKLLNIVKGNFTK